MSVLGQKRTSAVNCGVRYSPESKHCSYFALAQTHSSRKRERSSILIFCCSIRFSHSRIFSALSTGIIFSGAVAFMRSVTCADAACARNIAKVIGTENRFRRCGCTRSPTRVAPSRLRLGPPKLGSNIWMVSLWAPANSAKPGRTA